MQHNAHERQLSPGFKLQLKILIFNHSYRVGKYEVALNNSQNSD